MTVQMKTGQGAGTQLVCSRCGDPADASTRRCKACAAYDKDHNPTRATGFNIPLANAKALAKADQPEIFSSYEKLYQGGLLSSGWWVKAGGTKEQAKTYLTQAKAQSSAPPQPGSKWKHHQRVARADRTWSLNFVPQTYGGNEIQIRGTKKDRSKPEPVLYTGHLYTGYPQGLNKLAVVFKTGKTDHFEKERRSAARTFGIPLTNYETTKIAKDRQGPAEVDKRNALRRSLRSQYTVYHFGENDAVVISSINEEAAVINAYFKESQKATAQVIA